jgi:hypothetical protein
MQHLVFPEPGRLPQSRASRLRDAAIHLAGELLAQAYDIRRILEPNGTPIERAELDGHYGKGRSAHAADGSWHGAPRTNPTSQIVPSTLIRACDL